MIKSVLSKYQFGGIAAFVMLALIIAAGCVLRLRSFNAENRSGVTGYYSLAVSLRTSGVMAYPASPATPTAYRGPLYPAFLSVFAGEGPGAMRAAFLAQLLVFILTLLLVWATAGTAADSGAAALAAAGIYAFHPGAIAGAASFEVEFFYGFLLAAAAAAGALAAVNKNSWKYWALAFGIAGISISCKSPTALFPALLAAWLYFTRRGGEALKKKLPLLLVLAYLALVPWTARNMRHFKAFIPLERNASLCNIYSAGAGMPGTCLPYVAEEKYRREGRGELYSPSTSALSLIKGILLRPGSYLEGSLRRLPLAFSAFPFLLVLSFAGFLACRKNEGMLPLGLLAAYFTGVHLVFSFEARYLLPALPLFSVLAAAPAGRLFGAVKAARRFSEKPLAGSVAAAVLCVILPVYALSVYLLAAETLRKDLKPLGKDEVETLVPVLVSGRSADVAAYSNQKGVLKLFSGDFKPAAIDFAAAIKADPHYPDPYLNLAFALRSLGDAEGALLACRGAEAQYPACAPAGVHSELVLAGILACQETSLNSLGRKAAAGAVAARRRALESRAAAQLLK